MATRLRRAAFLALAVCGFFSPVCRALPLKKSGGPQAELAGALDRQQPAPSAGEGLVDDDDAVDWPADAGASSRRSEEGYDSGWMASMREARASSLRTVARLLASQSRQPGRPPMEISHVCASFGLDEAACERVKLYLGRVSRSNQTVALRVKEVAHSFAVNRAVAISLRDVGCSPNRTDIGHNPGLYRDDLCKAFEESGKQAEGGASALSEKTILFYFGDGATNHFCNPTLIKTRSIPGDDDNSVLLDLNHERHWGLVNKVLHNDESVRYKRPRLIWRGSSTGGCNTSKPGSRMMLASKYFGAEDKRIDVGISHIVQGCDEARQYFKDKLSLQEQLQWRYILVVDGNDKASGLNWALASESVPFMVEPTVESWLMESSLRPYVHYVPVKPDFSDLSSQLDWAQANLEKINQIALAGKSYVQALMNATTEANVEGSVLTAYLDRVEVASAAAADGVNASAIC